MMETKTTTYEDKRESISERFNGRTEMFINPEEIYDEIERLRATLTSAYGCLCYVQHNATLDRSLIQKEIDDAKLVLKAGAQSWCSMTNAKSETTYLKLNGWQQTWICFAEAFCPILLHVWGKQYVR